MLLEIRHVTQYRYAEPVRESVMELWMQPQKSPRQRLISFDLELDPPAQLFSYADSFGNPVYHFDVPQPHDRLAITARSQVETQALPPLPDALDGGEWERLRSDYLRREQFDFLHPHGFARETEALHAFMARARIDELRQRDPLTAIRELSRRLYDAFGYETGVTRADSPIDDMLKAGAGVCQDFAHLMLAICRSWGVPARYVSGYMHIDRRHGDRSDPDSTHAWVEVFLPSLRWIGFDATNNTEVGERHVPCAIGRDYSDVPPSRGVYKGQTEGELAVGVSVRKSRAAVTEPEYLRVYGNAMRKPGRRGPSPASLYEQQRLHALMHQQQQQQQ